MKSLVKKIGVGLVIGLPLITGAQGTTLTGAGQTIQDLIVTATQIVIGLVFIYFVWGLMRYLLGTDENKDSAKWKMIYSVLIMFVMFSIWGIINLLNETFLGGDTGSAPTVELPGVQKN